MTPRTLVIHTGGIGDLVCALPALARIGQETRIAVAGIPARAALAVAAGIADTAFDLDATEIHTVFDTPSARLRAFCASFDRAVVWMNDPDGAIARGLGAAEIPEVQCFPGIPPAGWHRHAATWYAHCLGVDIALPFRCTFPAAACVPDIILHPGSGDPKKNWPLEHFGTIAERLRKAGHTVAWCLGPAEEDAPPLAPALPEMPLVDLAGVLSRARLFIGNDSGIGHLASLAGCPTLTIFGPTDPAVWRPFGAHAQILQGNPWPDVAAVWTKARAMLL